MKLALDVGSVPFSVSSINVVTLSPLPFPFSTIIVVTLSPPITPPIAIIITLPITITPPISGIPLMVTTWSALARRTVAGVAPRLVMWFNM